MATEAFWLERPSDLFKSGRFLPSPDMNKVERLNAITRLLLVVTAVLFLSGTGRTWLTVLITGVAVVLTIYFLNVKQREGFDDSFTFRGVNQPQHGRTVVYQAPPQPPVTQRPHRPGLIGQPTLVAPDSQFRLRPLQATPTVFRKR